jgi:hypothetical protein
MGSAIVRHEPPVNARSRVTMSKPIGRLFPDEVVVFTKKGNSLPKLQAGQFEPALVPPLVNPFLEITLPDGAFSRKKQRN